MAGETPLNGKLAIEGSDLDYFESAVTQGFQFSAKLLMPRKRLLVLDPSLKALDGVGNASLLIDFPLGAPAAIFHKTEDNAQCDERRGESDSVPRAGSHHAAYPQSVSARAVKTVPKKSSPRAVRF